MPWLEGGFEQLHRAGRKPPIGAKVLGIDLFDLLPGPSGAALPARRGGILGLPLVEGACRAVDLRQRLPRPPTAEKGYERIRVSPPPTCVRLGSPNSGRLIEPCFGSRCDRIISVFSLLRIGIALAEGFDYDRAASRNPSARHSRGAGAFGARPSLFVAERRRAMGRSPSRRRARACAEFGRSGKPPTDRVSFRSGGLVRKREAQPPRRPR